MAKRINRQLFLLVFISILLLQPIMMNAARKPSKKQLALWEQIEKNANQENTEATIKLCKTLIGTSLKFDSLACLSRSLLAEYYLTTEDLYSVYDCYVFFREYSKIPTHQDYAEDYRDNLYTYYHQLLSKELQSDNYEGVWFSDMQGDSNQPFIAFSLRSNANGEASIKIWEGCQFYKEFAKYKTTEGVSVDKTSLILENMDSDSLKLKYFAQWGDQRIKNAKYNTAMTLQEMSNTVHTETSRAIASAPSGKFEEKLAAQVASSLFQVLLEVGADLFSTSSVKSYAATLNFGAIADGEMPAELILDTQTIVTGQNPISGSREIKFKLYKWYPHNEVNFMTGNYTFDQFICPPVVDKNLEKYNRLVSPFVYEYGNKNGRKVNYFEKKKFNSQIYIDFARERVFGKMYNDTIKNYIPLPDQMNYYSYSGEIVLVGWDAKNRREENFKAEKKSDGTISFYQMDGSKLSGLRSGYYPNGEHHVCKVYENVKQGKYLIYNSEEELLGYNFYADGKKEGKSRWRVDGGWLEKQWNEDILQGLPKIVYDNGDVYEGEVNDFKPNGKGTMKLVTGKVVTGDWKEGKYVPPLQKKNQRKRKR